MTKHMTHDGRTHERKKLTLEEVNQIKPEVSKEVNQVEILNAKPFERHRLKPRSAAPGKNSGPQLDSG